MDIKEIKKDVRYILFNILENKHEKNASLLKEVLRKLDMCINGCSHTDGLYALEKHILQKPQKEDSQDALDNIYNLIDYLK